MKYTTEQLASMDINRFRSVVEHMSHAERKQVDVRPPFPKERTLIIARKMAEEINQHKANADRYGREADQHKANADRYGQEIAHHQRCVAELTRQEIELNKQIAASREKERQAIKEFGETVQKQEKRNNQQKDEPCCSIF